MSLKIIMFFYLKISCKDKRILKKFIGFFKKLDFLPIFVKSFPKHEKRKFVTVLKSPHINKTAQEQFEYRYYSKYFLIRSFKPLTFFVFLKKLKNLSFPGVKLKVQGLFEKKNIYKKILRIITPDNIVFKNVSSKRLKQTKNKSRNPSCSFKIISANSQFSFLLPKKYIQLFDLYGEVHLKSSFYF